MNLRNLFLIVLIMSKSSLIAMDMIEKPIEGDCFIIPNSLRTFDDGYIEKQQREALEEKFGCKFTAQTYFMALWVSSSTCDDWSDHEHFIFGTNGFPTNFPIDMLKDKDEGDTITFTVNVNRRIHYEKGWHKIKKISVPVRLRCKQLRYRFADWGTFKRVFERYSSNLNNKRNW